MIPIKIQIKNFLSYGSELQTIDFSPYHLVCLSGKNGHGKSALLDAITWAIWGQARKVGGTSKADQGLLRLGQTHMVVMLDFECNSIQYRIRREFALTYGKPYAALDFGIVNEAEDSIMPLTEKTIRGTQQKIEDTIRLNYDSFINSAFLRQGHANEFSKKSPKDRKEILAHILGLQRYELLRKLAHDRVREKIVEKQQLISMQEKMTVELAKRNEIDLLLVQTQEQLKLHIAEEQTITMLQQQLQQQYNELIRLNHEQAQGKKEFQELNQHVAQQMHELQTAVMQWRTIHKEQLSLQSLHLLKKQKTDLTTALEKMQKQLQEKLQKQELYLKAQQSMVIFEQQLKQEQMQNVQQKQMLLQHRQLQCQQFKQQLQQCQEQQKNHLKGIIDLQATIVEAEKQIQASSTIEIEKIEKQFEKRRAFYQQWIAQANWIKSEGDQNEQKKSLVDDDSSPSCPLCEQNLSATRKKFLKHKLAKNEQFLTHRYHRLKRLIQTLKQTLIEQHEQLTKLKQKQNELNVEQHKLIVAKQQKVELDKAHKIACDQEANIQKELTEHQKIIHADEEEIKLELKRSEQKLFDNPQYKKEHEELIMLKQAYEATIYKQDEHRQLQEQLHAIEKKLHASEGMQQEITLQDERKKRITLLCQTGKDLKKKTLALEQHLAQYAVITGREQKYREQESLMEQKRILWNKGKDQLLQETGRLEQQQQHLKKMHDDHMLAQKHIQSLTHEIDDYQEISNALSKNGIQALLIEDAIPEIEQEANDLLAKLTDNQATILIESLRDLKSGGTKETLDIKISDAIGIRPYEMFSGGEAFRIDFSLRIAISKLLARRAGTSLQTLIIDEGFGSQDEEGLSYIMDAIYKIQESFKKIIIVSHLPRLKDQFPVHFYVHKNPQGSHVQIIEQA